MRVFLCFLLLIQVSLSLLNHRYYHHRMISFQQYSSNIIYEFEDNAEDDYTMRFNNVARLYSGDQEVVLSRLRSARVLVIGLGGVGSWVVESLARSGIGALVLVDLDDVCISNVNRQLPALSSTIGKFKGDVLKTRVLDINPTANVTFIADFIRPDNIDVIFQSILPLDYVVDCADGVTDKAAIIDYCVQRGISIAVSGGAGGVTDPTLIRVSDMARAVGDTLIMRVRKKLRQDYGYPAGKNTNSEGAKIDKKWSVLCAHSLPTGAVRQSENKGTGSRKCDAVYGNTVFGTGTLGFALSSIVVNAIATGNLIRPKRLGAARRNNDKESASAEITKAMVSDEKASSLCVSVSTNVPESNEIPVCCPALSCQSSLGAAVAAASISDMDAVLAAEPAEYFDSHCHLQLHPACTTSSGAHDLVTSAISRGVTRMSVCGTCPGDDWRAVERLCEQHEGNLLPNFGLHPWWIARYRTSSPETMPWDQQLCRLLEKHTVAGVGECGLDKAVKREVTIEEQEKILSSHISIASQYDRVLTLHCVGLWGRLLEMLAAVNTGEPKPKAVILHSCNSMPAELVTAFDRLENVYFSLSAGNYGNAKFRRLALAIPKAKLLLETDSPDQLSSSLRVVASSNEPSFITYHCVQLATFLEMTHSELAQLTRQNAMRAYSKNYK